MAEIIAEVERKFPGEVVTRGEIFPTNTVPLLVGREMTPLAASWGLPKYGGKKGVIINARAETVAEKPTFQRGFFNYRCVVPCTGFYEWTQTKPQRKYQFRIAESGLLYLAGLYRPEAEGCRFVIITTAANSSMADIHNRMPVVLPPDRLAGWLNDLDEAQTILASAPPELMRFAV